MAWRLSLVQLPWLQKHSWLICGGELLSERTDILWAMASARHSISPDFPLVSTIASTVLPPHHLLDSV